MTDRKRIIEVVSRTLMIVGAALNLVVIFALENPGYAENPGLTVVALGMFAIGAIGTYATRPRGARPA